MEALLLVAAIASFAYGTVAIRNSTKKADKLPVLLLDASGSMASSSYGSFRAYDPYNSRCEHADATKWALDAFLGKTKNMTVVVIAFGKDTRTFKFYNNGFSLACEEIFTAFQRGDTRIAESLRSLSDVLLENLDKQVEITFVSDGGITDKPAMQKALQSMVESGLQEMPNVTIHGIRWNEQGSTTLMTNVNVISSSPMTLDNISQQSQFADAMSNSSSAALHTLEASEPIFVLPNGQTSSCIAVKDGQTIKMTAAPTSLKCDGVEVQIGEMSSAAKQQAINSFYNDELSRATEAKIRMDANAADKLRHLIEKLDEAIAFISSQSAAGLSPFQQWRTKRNGSQTATLMQMKEEAENLLKVNKFTEQQAAERLQHTRTLTNQQAKRGVRNADRAAEMADEALKQLSQVTFSDEGEQCMLTLESLGSLASGMQLPDTIEGIFAELGMTGLPMKMHNRSYVDASEYYGSIKNIVFDLVLNQVAVPFQGTTRVGDRDEHQLPLVLNHQGQRVPYTGVLPIAFMNGDNFAKLPAIVKHYLAVFQTSRTGVLMSSNEHFMLAAAAWMHLVEEADKYPESTRYKDIVEDLLGQLSTFRQNFPVADWVANPLAFTKKDNKLGSYLDIWATLLANKDATSALESPDFLRAVVIHCLRQSINKHMKYQKWEDAKLEKAICFNPQLVPAVLPDDVPEPAEVQLPTTFTLEAGLTDLVTIKMKHLRLTYNALCGKTLSADEFAALVHSDLGADMFNKTVALLTISSSSEGDFCEVAAQTFATAPDFVLKTMQAPYLAAYRKNVAEKNARILAKRIDEFVANVGTLPFVEFAALLTELVPVPTHSAAKDVAANLLTASVDQKEKVLLFLGGKCGEATYNQGQVSQQFYQTLSEFLSEDEKSEIEKRMLDWRFPDKLSNLTSVKQASWLHANSAFSDGHLILYRTAMKDPLFWRLKVLSGTETEKVKEVFGDAFEQERRNAAALEARTGFKTLRELKTHCNALQFEGREKYRQLVHDIATGKLPELSGFQRLATSEFKKELKSWATHCVANGWSVDWNGIDRMESMPTITYRNVHQMMERTPAAPAAPARADSSDEEDEETNSYDSY